MVEQFGRAANVSWVWEGGVAREGGDGLEVGQDIQTGAHKEVSEMPVKADDYVSLTRTSSTTTYDLQDYQVLPTK